MQQITKFLECLVPVTICNIECEYCYIIQQGRRNMCNPKWNYSVETVAAGLSKKRLGGMAYISICGAGETLVSDEVVDLVPLLLKEGHAVNITTNGTLSKKIDKLLNASNEDLKRLNFSFSFHFIELKKKNMLDIFFENIDKVRKAGCSFVLQLNLYDGYLPYLDEIKEISLKKVGALPQVAVTRTEEKINNITKFKFYTDHSDEEYINIAREFNSPLFEFTLKNFNVKRKEFCYAGLWSGVLNLQSGIMNKCYGCTKGVDIFKDIEKEIYFTPVGKGCVVPYCVNSSHFMSLGIIPELDTPTYGELRNRNEAGWYNETMKELLSGKLYNANKQLTYFQRVKVNIKSFPVKFARKFINIFPNIVREMVRKAIK